ncbi:hypothetical protein F66182_2299 [Fusarium sp. NRRL 66182]|nr:hypothetical protein F66182_2299 [Fusarium sp. NRRL 66182]
MISYQHLCLFFTLGFLLASGHASILFAGGTVIAFERETESLRIIRNGSVLVDQNKIAAVFSGSYNGTASPITETIDISGDIITTGFIDTHRHGSQTAFKTLASNTSLVEYVDRYSAFAPDIESIFTAEDVYIGQLAGYYEALNAGVTTIVDYGHHTWTEAAAEAGLAAAVESGTRIFWCYAFFDRTGFTLTDQIANFRELAASGITSDSIVTLGMAYEAFNPGPPEAAQRIIDLARSVKPGNNAPGSLLTNSPENLHAMGILNTSIPIIFAHASYLTTEGAELLRQTNQYISITPESEMHYGHDNPVSHLIQDQASLGIDTHFTFSSDLLTQARIWLQATRQMLYRKTLQNWELPVNNPMSVNQAFLLATRSGGLALRREDLGILAEGAKADLVVWDGNSPSMLGWSDPVAAVMLHASIGDIKHVVVDGKFKKRDRKLAEGYGEIQERFLKSARKIQEAWKNRPYAVYEGKAANGFDYARAKVADVMRGSGNGYGDLHLE